MTSGARNALIGALAALAAGVLFSFGVITIRYADKADAFQYLFWRALGLLPTLVIAGFWVRQSPIRQAVAAGWLGIAGAACLTLASTSFVFALKETTVANAVLFSSCAPLMSSFLAWGFLGERIGFSTWLAILLGLVGLAVMTWSELGTGNFVGNLAAVASAFGYAGYSIVARLGRGRDLSGVVGLYGVMTLAVAFLMLLVSGRPVLIGAFPQAMALIHGAIFIGIGIIAFNFAARHVKAVQLTLLGQTETILGPVWVYLIFAEIPKLATVIGGSIILAAVLISARTSSAEAAC